MSCFEGKQVLITGGVGFIGSNLAKALVSQGAKVTLIDSLIPEYGCNLWNIEPIKNEVSVNYSDVRDQYSMNFLVQGKDFLFNLAGQTSHLDSMQNPFPDLEINARAQLSILEACRHHNPNIRVVFASTRQVYGTPKILPVDENHPVQPVDVNGINKIAGESYHLVYCKVYGIKTSILRLTNTYGPGMRVKDARQTFLGIWIKRLLSGEPIQIFGDGKQVRDYNFVDDVVDALLLTATSDEAIGEVFNLGAEDPMSLKRTAEIMVSLEPGSRSELVPFPNELKKIDIGDYYSDFRKIRSRLNWRPKVDFEQGMKRTMDFYREHLSHYVDELL